ncbi:MAG: tRNA (adenosine(37)-N6)-threonylcarbamoyltransferase complex transferase subunit TsaD [Armatimonadetes bacterium]|nr:tRNA (adenosine(37)-N6)-threonylcarbamoyltransferase complex transferase subunit TsaD [Armatimonadota bacterium]
MTLFEGPILAIETSCDETSAAVLRGSSVLSNVVSSQIAMHEQWGGIVPEAAARAHIESILPVIESALDEAQIAMDAIRAIAVTNRPGLVGALSVGVTAAKSLAYALRIPILGVDHLEGHLLACLANDEPLAFPMASLLVSGGHSELVLIRGLGDYQLIGHTRDDAAGEAFDKGARLLGLGYPGGRRVSELAIQGNPKRYSLPRGLAKERYDLSFSGLKTAMLRLVEAEGEAISVPDACASLQAAICDSLIAKLSNAVEDFSPKSIGLCGGVAANGELRSQVLDLGNRYGLPVLIPAGDLCTDNAAMIGLVAAFRLERGEQSSMDLDVQPNSELFR